MRFGRNLQREFLVYLVLPPGLPLDAAELVNGVVVSS